MLLDDARDDEGLEEAETPNFQGVETDLSKLSLNATYNERLKGCGSMRLRG